MILTDRFCYKILIFFLQDLNKNDMRYVSLKIDIFHKVCNIFFKNCSVAGQILYIAHM